MAENSGFLPAIASMSSLRRGGRVRVRAPGNLPQICLTPNFQPHTLALIDISLRKGAWAQNTGKQFHNRILEMTHFMNLLGEMGFTSMSAVWPSNIRSDAILPTAPLVSMPAPPWPESQKNPFSAGSSPMTMA